MPRTMILAQGLHKHFGTTHALRGLDVDVQEGTILAVGPGRTLDDGTREPIEVAVGQKILFQKYAGTEFKLDEDELLILSQKDVLAVIE